ncbi:MAG: acylphosphatase [Candidatus Abyssobacteria bacterium SURF_5]|uniref:Acylphosphatase n=1 Tax=Abyssobacteria bacterium (strain SURF_5) TaxID=2093360 RepID=A0A3A4NJW3_ABYX5|nr:MAG: acylphosphatase [Candidatus Abyssubacteria bacterium SURF_5]
MSSNARVRLIVEGRVQGVFFRYTTNQQATRLGLTGWVMNRPDGAVEIVAEGPREALNQLIAWARHGPPGARVTDLKIKDEPYTGEFDGFDVKYSGW